MEQGQSAGTNRVSPDEPGHGREDAGRAAGVRARALQGEGFDPSQGVGSQAPRLFDVNTHYRGDDRISDLKWPDPVTASVIECADAPRSAEVAALTRTVVSQGIEAAFQRIEALRAGGMTLEAIYLDLLGPTAAHLGNLWQEDLCDFTEVTIGLGRLHQLLRELGPEFRSELECVNLVRRILLVPASGEQHTLGFQMVADFFARAGWDVWGGRDVAGGDPVRLVRDEWFDVVGLTVGCGRGQAALAEDIRSIRATSCNKAVRVIVGGPGLKADPEWVKEVGADALALDGRQALREAERLVALSGSADGGAY